VPKPQKIKVGFRVIRVDWRKSGHWIMEIDVGMVYSYNFDADPETRYGIFSSLRKDWVGYA